MEDVIDKIIEEVGQVNLLDEADGGIADILPLQAIYFGDPGIIPASLYPCVTVSPDLDDPEGETTGYDKRALRVHVSLHIDARQYFDASADEAMGDRMLVKATFALTRWFRRRSKRTLDGLVIDTAVQDTAYRQLQRGNIPAKSSRTTLVVRKTYARNFD